MLMCKKPISVPFILFTECRHIKPSLSDENFPSIHFPLSFGLVLADVYPEIKIYRAPLHRYCDASTSARPDFLQNSGYRCDIISSCVSHARETGYFSRESFRIRQRRQGLPLNIRLTESPSS